MLFRSRSYTREEYLDLTRRLKEAIPGLALSTDIIVGFPGETEEDFEETLSLVAEADYDMAYVFKYSVRTGTPAAGLGDPVDEAVKEARNQELLRRLEENSRRRTGAMVGAAV